MSLSAIFIRRPVATSLLALGILLLGILSYARLPIAALPSVDRPTIGVWAYLPGASPDTIATSLAQPLERQLGTIPGIVEMGSFSDTGYCEITLQFDLSTDIDAAAGAVQAAINTAGPNLPQDLPQPPQYYKSNPAGFPVIAIALTSEVVAPGDIYNYADSVVAQKLSQIDGVAKVFISGAERNAVRVQVDPGRIAAMRLSFEQIRAAIRAATQNMPKGAITAGGQSFTVATNDQLFKAAEYRDIVIAYRDGAPIRLGDIAAVTDSVINDKVAGWFDKEPAVLLYVVKQPDANVVATVDQVKALLPELQRWIPPAVKVHVVYDRSRLIRAAVDEVQFTVLLAIFLVTAAVALFLKRLWATVIPALAIPLALAATLAAMALFGYSLDNLSLMALTIAVGFVVDDAIVIIENVIRRIERGEAAIEAAREGSRQMGFTIVSITVALIAALIPVLFMPDVVGRYFREFGVTLVAAIAASAIVSLSFTPMLCGNLLGRVPHAPMQHAASPRMRRGIAALYAASLDWTLRHRWIALAATAALVGGTGSLYVALPKGFMPTQDTGVLRVRTITISNISFAAMEELQREAATVILADPAVDGLASYIGMGNGDVLSSGFMWVNLKPPEQRRATIQQVIALLRPALSRINNLRTVLTPAQDLNLGIDNSGSRYQYSLAADSVETLARWAEIMRRRLAAMPELADVVPDWETQGLQAGLRFDRVHAAAMGVTPMAIDNALYDAFGQRQIRTIYLPFNYARVILEADPRHRGDPSAFGRIFVPGGNGAAVPLSSLTQTWRAHAPMWVRHRDQFPAMTISFDTRPGVSIGQAIDAIRAAQRAVRLPDEIKTSFRGEAGEASRSAGRQGLLFLGALFAIYVALGVLYESCAHPFTILSTLPAAAFGALLALRLTGSEFTLVTSIACILLVGMVMKNAIIMVDFALDLERSGGMPAQQAIREAARRRVRPILMTTMAAAMTAMPLAIGTGPGFELRQPLGIAIVGGLLVSQLLTLYTVPAIYLTVDRLRRRRPERLDADPDRTMLPVPELARES